MSLGARALAYAMQGQSAYAAGPGGPSPYGASATGKEQAMSSDTEQRRHTRERLEHLRTLRDEIRVDVHLAGMELKQRWQELEPKMRDAERLAEDVSDVARSALDDIVERFRSFRDTLRARREQDAHPHT
jgi:hypothetical protein